jgi:hypothetical protein
MLSIDEALLVVTQAVYKLTGATIPSGDPTVANFLAWPDPDSFPDKYAVGQLNLGEFYTVGGVEYDTTTLWNEILVLYPPANPTAPNIDKDSWCLLWVAHYVIPVAAPAPAPAAGP